jgi:argininosuccinate lyase
MPKALLNIMLNAALTVWTKTHWVPQGYGSSPIDRTFTTKELGFETLKYNAAVAQMSRGKSENPGFCHE